LRKLSRDEYDALVRGAQVLVSDRLGPKVLRTDDGRIVKLFRRRKLISSALFWPPARRFARASRRLGALGIACAAVEGVYRVPHIQRHAVVYPEIAGEALRDAIRDAPRRDRLLEALAGFLAELHAAGVYFRAVHFGNVLVRADGRFALIDLSEVRVKSKALGTSLRRRNFKPLLAYPEDAAALRSFGLDRFLDLYRAASQKLGSGSNFPRRG
jgi:hypothetical protein